jgi:hypothetical protein
VTDLVPTQMDPNAALLSPRAQRNINRKRRASETNQDYRTEIEELLAIRDEIVAAKPVIEANWDLITEQMANTMSRAYAANPHMNPQMIVAAVFAGADEATIYQMAQEVAEVQHTFGLYSGDQFDQIEKAYPWAAHFKKDLREGRVGEVFQPDYARQMGVTEQPAPTEEWWKAQTDSRWHRMLRVPKIARDDKGELGLLYDSKSLGGVMKVNRDELERRRPPETNAIERYLEWAMRRTQRQKATLNPVADLSAEISEISEAATVHLPNVAMIQAISLTDNVLAPVRWALDKVTPDFISDPASDVMRGATRWGFSGLQSVMDMPENLIMSATADPTQAPLGFRRQIERYGVLDGLGKGFENAFFATSFGQASRDLFTGREVDTGSGFFMGGRAQEQADKLKMFTLGYYTDDNNDYLRTRSFGTGTAEFLSQLSVIDRDSFSYNVVSGGIDATWEIFADPTRKIKFTGWGDESIKGLRNLNSKTATKVADHLEEARRLDDKAINETNQQIADTLRAFSDQESRQALEALGINTRKLDRAGVRAAKQNLTEQEVAIRSLLLDEAGVIREGERRTVVMPEFAKFLIRGRGRRLVKEMQEATSPEQIKLRFQDRIGYTAAVQLADATNADDIVRILARGISDPSLDLNNAIRMAPHIGLFSLSDKGLWVRRNISPYTRLGNVLPPGSTIDPNDGNTASTVIRQVLNVIPTDTSLKGLRRYDSAKKQDILDQFHRAFASGNKGEVKKAFGRLADELVEVFIGLGYDPVLAKALTRFVKNDERLSAFRWTDVMSGAPIDTTPLAFNDLMSSSIEIIDPRRLQQVIRQSGRVRQITRNLANLSPDIKQLEKLRSKYMDLRAAGKNDEAEKVVENIRAVHQRMMNKKLDDPTAVLDKGFLAWSARTADQVNDAWKTYQIARFAYVLRVVPEELGRVLLTGVFDSWTDWFVTMLSSSEKMNLSGRGRYLGDVANRRFTRKAKQSQKLEVQHELLVEELNDLLKAGQGSTPRAVALRKEIDVLSAKFDAEIQAWDANFKSYQEAQIGSDRTLATRTVTRNRAKQQFAIEGTAFATRRNASQIPQWIDGVIERIMKMSNDAGGMQDFARAWLGQDVGGKFQFELNGVMGTVKQHLNRGEDFEDVMAHHYVFGGGRTRYRQYVRALNAQKQVIDPNSLDDARTWVDQVIREMENIVGRSAQSIMFPNMLPAPFQVADEKLMRAIATGRFNGLPLQKTEGAKLGQKNGKYVWNKEFRDHVELWGLNDYAPDWVFYRTRSTVGEDPGKALQGFANFIFGIAYGASSDLLARSPTWRRIYWKQVAEFVKTASPEEAKDIIRNAEKAKLDKRLMEKLRTNARMSTGNATWEDIDGLSRAAATDLTKDLLFDATRRGATSDAMRLVVAFGDAWYEVLKTWTRANVQRGGTPVKSLMKGIEGARDMSLFGEMAPSTTWEYDPETDEYEQITSQKRRGFFYKDPMSDQWMYNMPMSGPLARTFMSGFGRRETGPGGELRAAVEGLNIFGTLSPGVGPLGSIVAQTLVPNNPSWDWFADILYPIQKPLDVDTQASADIGGSKLIPNWIKRGAVWLSETTPLAKGFVDLIYNYQRDPAFMNLQVNIMKSLDSTGNYSWDAAGRKQLQEDTEKSAKNLMGLMALAYFVGPAAPSFRHLLQTKDPETGEIMGNITGHQFAQELNDLRRLYIDLGEDPNQAVSDMVYYYGPEVELSVVPNTNSAYPGQELSQEWWDWFRTGDTQEFVDTYPSVAAFFGAVNAERDNDAAGEMRSSQLTTPKTLEQLDEDARRLRAYRRYNQFLKNNGLDGPEARRTDEQRIRIAEYRNELERYFRIALDDRTSQNLRETQLGTLQTMIDIYRSDDPADAKQKALISRHLESPTGQAIMVYMDLRAATQIAGTKFAGLTEDGWASSRVTAPMRDRMREMGTTLSQLDPGFARLYQFVLEREMLAVDRETADMIRVGRPVGVR